DSPMRWPVLTTASTSSCPLVRLGVPTQMSDTSDAAIASSLEVVARRRFAPTTRPSSSASPGSTTGGVAVLILATFSALTSTPITSWPAFATQAAVTHPTYPSPKTLTRMAKHLLASGFEFRRHPRPPVPLLHAAPTRDAERSATRGIVHERRHGPGEFRRIVGPQEVLAGDKGKALGTDRCRDDCLGHRERLEDLQSRPAADPQGHHEDRRIPHVWSDVVHEPGHSYTSPCCHREQTRGGVTADDRQRRLRHIAPDAREDRFDEVRDTVLVGVPVHRTGEAQSRWRLPRSVRREVVDVDARRNRADTGAVGDGAQEPAVPVRHGYRQVRASTRPSFVAPHLARL